MTNSLEAVERLEQDLAAYSWRNARIGMVEDGEVIGYPSFSKDDLKALISALRSQAEALDGLLVAIFSEDSLAKSDDEVRGSPIHPVISEALIAARKARTALTPEVKS